MFDIKEKIKSREATISIVGLGYVGSPLARAFSNVGFKVIGFDINEKRINEINEDSETKFEVTSDPSRLNTDLVIICVPTPVDNENTPDLSPIKSASSLIGKNMKKNSIIILESTVYPGVTEEVMKPVLEKESGLICGNDFSIGYSPERISPGDEMFTLENLVKVVSGYNKETSEAVKNLYETIVKAGVYEVKNIKTAEAVKVVENTQRLVNISLVNELSVIFDKMGINTLEVINAAKTKKNFIPFFPNAGVGGHCISVDPYYLIHKSMKHGYNPKIISSSMEINEFMPVYVTNHVLNHIQGNESPKVLILGLTYKENIPDTRNTSAKKIAKEFAKNGIKVYGYDPIINEEKIREMGIIPLKSIEEINDVNCFIYLVPHEKLNFLNPEYFKKMSSENSLVFDIRSVLNREEIEALGMKYRCL